MSTYLDEYGAADARREKVVKTLIGVIVVVAILAGILWYFLRDYSEVRQVHAFLDALDAGDYQAAYAMWGCTETEPCVNYPFESFMEDWGPAAIPDPDSLDLGSKRSCSGGIIQTLQIGEDEILLWVGRQDGMLSFSPFEACYVRFAPESPAP